MTRWTDCIFDLYGTLVDIRTDEGAPELWEAMAALYRREGAAYAPEELHRLWRRTIRTMEEGLRARTAYPEIQIEEVFRELFRLRGVEASPETVDRTGQRFRELSTVYIRPYDGAAELLRALRANGQRVWLLSNAQRLFTAPELDRLGLTPLFDGIYLSSDWGCKKPDPLFFAFLLRGQAIDPARAVMVGNDGACDCLPAKAAGLSTVYLRSGLSPDEAPPPAGYVLEKPDLSRLYQLLTSAR